MCQRDDNGLLKKSVSCEAMNEHAASYSRDVRVPLWELQPKSQALAASPWASQKRSAGRPGAARLNGAVCLGGLHLPLGQGGNKRRFQRVRGSCDTTSTGFTLDHDPRYWVTLLNATVTLFPAPRLSDRRVVSMNVFDL